MNGYGLVVSLLAAAAVLSPLVRPATEDGFPISSYPMFARERPAQFELISVRRVLPTGDDAPVPLAALGTREAMQAISTVQRDASQGRAGVLCRSVADWYRRSNRAAGEILVVQGRYDVIATVGGAGPISTRVLARCKVAS